MKAGAGELTPNNTGSAITATRAGQRMASSAISNRSNANRTGVNSGEMMSSGGFWLQYAYSEAEQDKKDGVFGYEAETSGFSLGMDTGLGYGHHCRFCLHLCQGRYQRIPKTTSLACMAPSPWTICLWMVASATPAVRTTATAPSEASG